MTLLGPEPEPAAIGAALVVIGPGRGGAAGGAPAAGRPRCCEELTGRLVQERATAERAAVAEERSRIARELHDVIGHEVTVIALQADAAAAALAKAPERAAAPVEAIRRSAAEALAEMRRVVGMLRAAEEEDLRPQPGLDRRRRRWWSSPVPPGPGSTLTLRPPARPTHASVELAAYRLVQEALTNARRHAPGAPVDVRVVGRRRRGARRGREQRGRADPRAAGPRVVGLRAGRHARAGPAARGTAGRRPDATAAATP